MGDTTTPTPTGQPAAPAQPAADPHAPPAGSGQPPDDSAKLRQQLEEAQRKLASFEASQQEAETKRLEEQGKFRELAEKHRTDAVAARAALNQERVRNALLAASGDAADAGLVADILGRVGAVDDHGVVMVDGKSAAEAVKALLVEKPFLRKSSPQGGGAPAGGAAPPQPDLAAQLAEAKKRGDLAAVIRLTGEIGRQKPKS